MAYNNPILGAVQTNQAAQMQNKQFEASFGLRLAQFAENRKNTAADETYRQKVLGEDMRRNKVTEKAAADAVTLEAEKYKDLGPQRDADLASTKATTAYNTAGAGKIEQETSDLEVASDKLKLGKTYAFMQSRLMDNNGIDIPLQGNPEAQADFTTFMNMPGVNKTIQGKNGEQYEFVGIVPAGEDRSVVQIRDPENPDKVMYMSRDRTAVEGDPLTAVNLMGVTAFREKISIAVRQAADKDLPKDLQLAAEAFNAITNRPKDAPQTLGPNTLQESQDIAEEMAADEQQDPSQVGRNRTASGDYTKGITPLMAVSDPSAHDLSQYTHDELNSLSDVEWGDAIAAAKQRMDTMRMPGQNIDQQILQNQKRQESVTDQINNQTGPPNKGLQQQLDTLIKLGTTLTDRKAAGTDTFDAAQKAHNDLLDAKEFADGKKPAPSAVAKAAAKIVTDSKLSPRQLKNPKLDSAVEEEILKNPPPRAEIAQSIIKPMPMTPGLLYKLRAAQAMGMIDKDAIARVVDTGQLSVSGVELLKQQLIEAGEIEQTFMNNQTDLVKKEMDIAGTAATPYVTTTKDGTLQGLDKKTGRVLWSQKPDADQNDGRSQQDKMLVVEQHNDQGDNALDAYESVEALANNYNVATMPMLEQNLLSQNLNQVLYEELGVNGFDSPIDWLFGSDEDQPTFGPLDFQKFASINPMQKVTTRFALSADGTITMYDQFGKPHGDRDYKLSNVGNDAVQLALTKILKTPAEVKQNLIPMRIKAMEAELAERQAALGVK